MYINICYVMLWGVQSRFRVIFMYICIDDDTVPIIKQKSCNIIIKINIYSCLSSLKY